MRRPLPLLLLAVVLPGSLSQTLYGSLLRSLAPATDVVVAPPPALEVRTVEEVVSQPIEWEDRACRVQEERSRSLWGRTGDNVEIRAGTGTLQVMGIEGSERVRVRALLCASDRERLTGMDVELRRVMGPDVRLVTLQPDRDGSTGWSEDEYARIDLVVEVPLGTAVSITDASGPLTVKGVGELRIQDGAGEIEASSVVGNVRVVDGSGSLRLQRISGDVDVEAGSGAIAIRGVAGSVLLGRSSGSVEIQEVDGDVRVRPAVSGDVFVRQVGGDLLADGEGTGWVRYEAVGGHVSVAGREAPVFR